MEKEFFLTDVRLFLKKNWLAVVPGIIGLIFLGYGLIQLIVSSNSSDEILFTKGGGKEISESEKKIGKEIVIDVEGAVISPGVYNLSQNARIKDALIAAGGLSSRADREWVAKNLNLAAKLNDASKVYIPFVGETQVQGYSFGTTVSSFGLININTASLGELDTLSGVGQTTAQKIIDGRPYQTIDELVSKKIVKKSVFEKIKDKIAAY